jgi:basic membrane protein A
MQMRSTCAAILLPALISILGCGTQEGKQTLPRVALLLSVGGLGDKSFNDSAHEGLMKAKKDLPVKVFEGQPTMIAEDERYLRTYAARGFDLIIAVGFLMKSAVVKVAKDFPTTRFALIDAGLDPATENPNKNIATLLFKEHEGSYLVGAAAALASKTGKIGFVGGMEIPLIHKFQLGYEEGARKVNPNIEIQVQYAGSGPEAFSDPVKGKQLAEGMIRQGVDVIFHASGSTGNGVIEAARQEGKLAIGVDANQDADAPGFVMTSMIKRVDIAVFDIVNEVVEKRYRGEPHYYGLNENAVATSDFKFMKDPKSAGDRMDPERLDRILTTLDSLRREIIEGKIKVTNYEESQ